MYQTYAHKIEDNLRRELYKCLINNLNVTRDIDYIKCNKLYCENYVSAISNGYPKEFARRVLYLLEPVKHHGIYLAYQYGIDIDKCLNTEQMAKDFKELDDNATLRRDSRFYVKADEIRELLCRSLNPKVFENYLMNDNIYPIMDYVEVARLTNGKFIPDSTSVHRPYIQYLQYLNATNIDDILEEELSASTEIHEDIRTEIKYNIPLRTVIIKGILAEIELLLGVQTSQYNQLADILSIEDVHCIIAKLDVFCYIAMRVPNSLPSVYKYLTANLDKAEQYKRISKIYGLSLL